MQKTIIVANWKMNPQSLKEAQELFDAVAQGVKDVDGAEIVACPPVVYIPALRHTSYSMLLGAQNCFWTKSGAFTGEISPAMLRDLGCTYVILGHSERKNYLGETYEIINKKVKAVLREGLIPVVCIGEKERQGAHGNSKELERQMRDVLKEITRVQAKDIVLCYEPEWAISTNKGAAAAAPEDCAQSIASMREIVKELFGDLQFPILYGGSTNSENIRGFIGSGAQGALVGFASLDAEEFIQLVKNALME